MANFKLKIFGSDNVFNPQNPGNLPAEDGSFRSDLDKGDTITWLGGGEAQVITITDPQNDTFDEAQTNQTLTNDVSFDGDTYDAGQIVTPTYTIVFEGDDGESYTMTSFNFSSNTENQVPDAVFWEGVVPPDGTELTVVKEINPTRKDAREYDDMVICFREGTRLSTPNGPTPVEDLTAGSSVLTLSGVAKPIQWIGQRHVAPAELSAHPGLRPIVIHAGALGAGLPERDLRVSRQHRILIRSRIAERMFGSPSALVPAHVLLSLPGVTQDDANAPFRYFHIMLDQHDVIWADGLPAETLYLGPEARRALPDASLDELRLLFPELFVGSAEPPSAHFIPRNGRRQRQLVQRHQKNGKPLFEGL